MTAPAYRRSPVESISVEEILGRLESVRRNGEGRWMAKCPAHGDRTASLSVRTGDDGRILLHDFGGCSFTEIVGALDLRPEQLFPPRTGPWTPRRPRPDPDREARDLLQRLRHLRVPPPPERMRRELAFVGRVILGGTKALADVPAGFSSGSVKTFALRLLLEAAQALAKQGTPRRWFSVLALSRELDRAGQVGGHGPGYAKANRIFLWARLAVATARRDRG
jgi:hypothetical protein